MKIDNKGQVSGNIEIVNSGKTWKSKLRGACYKEFLGLWYYDGDNELVTWELVSGENY